MERSSAQPSTLFSIVTHRHPTEEAAIKAAMGYIENRIESHRLISPSEGVASLSTETTYVNGAGYTAKVNATVCRQAAA